MVAGVMRYATCEVNHLKSLILSVHRLQMIVS